MIGKATPGLGAALVAVALALACGRQPAPQPTPKYKVVLVGDSITAGMVSEPTGPPYAELLRKRLGPDFEVVNVACGGSSSLDWTRSRGSWLCGGKAVRPRLYDARVPPELPADFATVLLGSNDSIGIMEKRPVDASRYGAALREIATNLLADGAGRVVLLGPPLLIGRANRMLRIAGYDAQLHAICDSLPRVECGPDLRYLLTPDDFAEHNIHPNGAGHAKIADALAETLLRLVREEQRAPGATAPDAAKGAGGAG